MVPVLLSDQLILSSHEFLDYQCLLILLRKNTFFSQVNPFHHYQYFDFNLFKHNKQYLQNSFQAIWKYPEKGILLFILKLQVFINNFYQINIYHNQFLFLQIVCMDMFENSSLVLT